MDKMTDKDCKPIYKAADGHVVLSITPVYTNSVLNESYFDKNNQTSPLFFGECSGNLITFKSHKFIKSIDNYIKTDTSHKNKFLTAIYFELSMPHIDIPFGSFILDLRDQKLLLGDTKQLDSMLTYVKLLHKAVDTVFSSNNKTSVGIDFLRNGYNHLGKMIENLSVNENKTEHRLTYKCDGYTGHGILNTYKFTTLIEIEFDEKSFNDTKLINIEFTMD